MTRCSISPFLAGALSPENRATAEDRGLEYVEGAPRASLPGWAVDGDVSRPHSRRLRGLTEAGVTGDLAWPARLLGIRR